MPDPDEKEEIPAFTFSPKKVDDSWKEEARKEREAATLAAAAKKAPLAPAAPKAEAPATPKAAALAEMAGSAPDDNPAETAPPAKPQSPLEQQQTKIFLNFIDGLAQQALMQMGELENPYSGQAEMDLQGARYTIELLAVILAKTSGNLHETEHQALTAVLGDLKTHFAAIAQELQRQMQMQQAQRGAMRPGPGGNLK